MACHRTFPSCHEENDPNLKSGQDLDPDKPSQYVLCLVREM